MSRQKLGVLSCAALLLVHSAGVFAASPEYIMNNKPAPSSAKDIESPLSYGFLKEYMPIYVFKWVREKIREKLEPLPPFIRDTTIKAKVRDYYFNRNNSPFRNSEALALGGGIHYRSGWAFDRFRLGATLYTSQKLYGPDDKAGSLLLKPVQESFTVPGEAFIDIKLFGEISFRGYRQTFDYPYLNRQDSRMVPNTFEAYAIRHEPHKDLDWIIAQVEKIKPRFEDEFIPMSQAASFTDSDQGLTMAGFRYNFNKHDNFGAVNYYSWDVMNTFYTEANYLWRVDDAIPVKLSAQYTHQQSVGKALAGGFSTYSFGAQIATSYQGAVLTVAATSTGNGGKIRSPYGGRPSYLSMMVKDFDRLGEDAWLIGLSYDFNHFSFLDGLSAFTNYGSGYTPGIGAMKLPDQQEWDFTIDYRPTQGYLKGFWLRFRRSQVNQGTGILSNDSIDYRVILNFDIQLL